MAPTAGKTLWKIWWLPLLCYGLALWLAHTETIQLAELRTLDWRTRWRTYFQQSPDPRIVVTLFEDDTEAAMGPWPVDRALHGRMNDYLALEKTAVVAWDIILDASRPGGGDAMMVRDTQQAIQSGTKIVMAAATSHTRVDIVPRSPGPTQPLTLIEGDPANIPGADFALLPFPALQEASWWGAADAPRGADGIIRELPLLVRMGKEYFPSLSLQTLLVYLQVPVSEVRVQLGEAILLPAQDRTWRIPIDHRGMFLLNYRYDQPGGGADFRTFTYADLLLRIHEHRVDPHPGAPKPPDLTDHIVLVGQTVFGKADAGPTPLGRFSPLVLVHANALNNMLAGDYARRVPGWITWGLVLLFSYGGIVMLAHRSVIVLCGGAVLGLGGYGALATWLWIYGSWWLPALAPMLGFAVLQYIIIGRRIRLEQRARQEIKSLFGTYVSPLLVDRLVKADQPPQLGGYHAEITAYFSDIQEFTSIAESLPAEQLVGLMNEYLTACTVIIQEEGGTLDKYVGDAVVAMFGAPVPLPDHARRACRAAQRVQHKLAELRAKWRAEGPRWPPTVPTMQTRIGLNTGTCVIGNMGSHLRFNYTMMGDSVNLAARLESGAKHWGVSTLCSETTRVAAQAQDNPHLVFRPLGRIIFQGKTQPVAIHEIVGFQDDLTASTRECLDHFARGLEGYHARDWNGARECFKRSAGLESNQAEHTPGKLRNPSLRYLALVGEYSLRPPAPEWDGTYVMESK